MTLEFLKVIVQPVALERDDDGTIVAERPGEPVALYTLDHVVEFVERLQLELAQQQRANGGPPNRAARRAAKSRRVGAATEEGT
jgi:hypothetical protein